MVFIDGVPEIEEALRSSGAFRILASDELRKPLELIDTSSLDQAECRQVAYWKPATLGQLLFNYWD